MHKKLYNFLPYTAFALITALIMYPLYQEGFIFLLDMVIAPEFDLTQYISNGTISSGIVFGGVVKILSMFTSMAGVQKILLTLALLLPGVFMYRLSRKYIPQFWAVTAGVVYMINPWVYERFLAGHILVLFGYGVFPLALLVLCRLLAEPTKKHAVRFAVMASVYPLISLHWAYIFALTSVVVCIGHAILHKLFVEKGYIHKSVRYIFVLVIAVVVVNSFWLINFFSPQETFTSISRNDFAAFQTAADPVYGRYVNVASLYGFWSTDYELPKETLDSWWLFPLIMIALSVGGYRYFRKKKQSLGVVFSWLVIPVYLVSLGYAQDITKPIIDVLYSWLPGFKGLRETGKLIGVLAFVYALLAPAGGYALSQWVVVHVPKILQRVTITGTGAILLFLPIVSTHTMFGGFSRQIIPSDYPQSWYEARELLQTGDAGHMLVLPWHGYMRLSFSGNKNVSNPARVFFGEKTIVGRNIDNVFILETQQKNWDTFIFQLVHRAMIFDEYHKWLLKQNVTHIILLKEGDWERYLFLDDSAIIEKVLDRDEIIIYRIKELLLDFSAR